MDMKQEIHGIFTIAKREFFSNFFSMRMLILFIIFALSVIGIAYGLSDISARGGEVLKEELSADDILIRVSQTTIYIGSLSAIVLSFDSITRERITNCLDFILSKPISKRGILIGKFLGITFSLSILSSFICILSLITIAKLTNNLPSFPASVGFLIFTNILLGTFVLIQQIFSSLTKNLGTAIVFGIALWFFFGLFWLLIPLAIAYSQGVPLPSFTNPSQNYNIEFQKIVVKTGLFSPSGAYQLSIGKLLAEEDPALKVIHPSLPFISMFLWFFISLILAIEVFKRTQE